MNNNVWYLAYFEGVYHTRMFETFSNANAHMVHNFILCLQVSLLFIVVGYVSHNFITADEMLYW